MRRRVESIDRLIVFSQVVSILFGISMLGVVAICSFAAYVFLTYVGIVVR